MRNRILTAAEALELGLVHEVVPPEELPERAMALAVELANGPQVSMRLLKRSIYNAAEQTFAQALDDIAAKTAISDHHADALEGVIAFREKRPAKFNAWLKRCRAQPAAPASRCGPPPPRYPACFVQVARSK
jgi:2-(1,2-epoxy-1,2-dihydrophenyl)acetyl-CoA isomerase